MTASLWTNVALVVPAASVEDARTLSLASMDPDSQCTYSVPLSPSGTGDPTHYASAGAIDADYATLMLAKDGHAAFVLAKQGDPNFKLSQVQVQEVFDAMTISTDDFGTVLGYMGLKNDPPYSDA